MKNRYVAFFSTLSRASVLRRCAAAFTAFALLQLVSCVAPSSHHQREHGSDESDAREFVRGPGPEMQHRRDDRGDGANVRSELDGRSQMRAPMPFDRRGGPDRFDPRRDEFRGPPPFGPPPPFAGRRGSDRRGPRGPEVPPKFAPRFERGPGLHERGEREPGMREPGMREPGLRKPGLRKPGPFAGRPIPGRPFAGPQRLERLDDELEAELDELDLTPAQRDQVRRLLDRRGPARGAREEDLRLPGDKGQARPPDDRRRARRDLDSNHERDDVDHDDEESEEPADSKSENVKPRARRPRADAPPRFAPREPVHEDEHRGEI